MLSGIIAAVVLASCAYPSPVHSPVDNPTALSEVTPPLPLPEMTDDTPWPGAIWLAGYWDWDGVRYIWNPGRWASASEGWRWSPGHWESTDRGWRFVGARWISAQ